MVKTLFKLLIIFGLFVNLTSYAATTANSIKIFENKFDQNIIDNLTDDVATYIVYFDDDIKPSLTNKTSLSSQKINNQFAVQAQQQKQVSSNRTNILSTMTSEDYKLVRSYKAVPTIVIRASTATIREIAKSPLVLKIGLDNNGGSGHLNDAIPQTNIDLVKAIPLSGEGIEVAIIDSGLDQDHPDFANRVASQTCFSSDCDTSIYDQNGHGTNVAGIIAGAGGIAPQGGAPAVTLHILKVLDADNNFDSSSQVVSALDHIITELPNVKIINMSIGTSQLFTSVCDDSTSWTASLANAVDQLHARGVTLFASSGNEGDDTAITAPACLNNVIAVGATWDNRISNYTGFCNESSPTAGELTCFSNSSENVDIVAPGALMTATGRNHGLSNFAGTSMASPLVASCAVLLSQAKSTLTPLELRNALVENGGAMVTDSEGRNFPSLDCWQAYQSLVITEPDVDVAPVLTRLSPQESLLTMHSIIEFSVTAHDKEDGDISSQVTWWINDIDTGETGAIFEYDKFFNLEFYIVTAKVTDSANNETTLNWEISILTLPSPPPEIVISSPNNDSQYDSGQEVNFSATATDWNDGDISENIKWLYKDEIIAEGDSFSQIFESGTHTVMARVQNSIESSSQTEVTFMVNEPQPPVVTPPIVTQPSNSSGGGAIDTSLFMLLLIRLLQCQFFVKKP